jgi:hypothetical protein
MISVPAALASYTWSAVLRRPDASWASDPDSGVRAAVIGRPANRGPCAGSAIPCPAAAGNVTLAA